MSVVGQMSVSVVVKVACAWLSRHQERGCQGNKSVVVKGVLAWLIKDA